MFPCSNYEKGISLSLQTVFCFNGCEENDFLVSL